MPSRLPPQPAGFSERDKWLSQAGGSLRWYVECHGIELPAKVCVRVGMPTTYSSYGPTIGECFTANGRAPLIVVSSQLDDPVQVLAVLLHELVHAADPNGGGHGRWFRQRARRLGLVGPAAATRPGSQLTNHLHSIIRVAGPYPEAAGTKHSQLRRSA